MAYPFLRKTGVFINARIRHLQFPSPRFSYSSDVVGYSHLMGADEEGTLAQLNKLRGDFFHPKVSEYGGRIVMPETDGAQLEFWLAKRRRFRASG